MEITSSKRWIVLIAVLGALAGIGFYTWSQFQEAPLPDSFASGNGRIEATEVDIASKNAGRIKEILVKEGEWVKAGHILATMDTEETEAELREAQADLRRSSESKKYAEAIVKQRASELSYAKTELRRSQQLAKKGHVSKEQLDQHRTSLHTAEAALQAANVQVVEAEASIEAAEARVERLQVRMRDSQLNAPRDGRVLYRLAEPGEILGSGGKVLTILDLSDVYMTVFLPTSQATRVAIGADARIVLDALPDISVPAKVSFVASRSQFTPREVETRTEREKLMFRVKVKIHPDLLKQYAERVKTGVPGVAYIQLDANAVWPETIPAVRESHKAIIENGQ